MAPLASTTTVTALAETQEIDTVDVLGTGVGTGTVHSEDKRNAAESEAMVLGNDAPCTVNTWFVRESTIGGSIEEMDAVDGECSCQPPYTQKKRQGCTQTDCDG